MMAIFFHKGEIMKDGEIRKSEGGGASAGLQLRWGLKGGACTNLRTHVVHVMLRIRGMHYRLTDIDGRSFPLGLRLMCACVVVFGLCGGIPPKHIL